MAANIAVIAGAGAIGFYAYSKIQEAPTSGGVRIPPKIVTTNGFTSQPAWKLAIKGARTGSTPSKTSVALVGGTTDQVSAAIDEAKRALEARARAEFDKLSCDAKKAGTAALVAKYPSIKIDPDKACEASYDEIAKIVGATAAAAACNVVPGVGTLASPLCAIVGAYIGDKIEDWISDHWSDVEGAAKDAVDAVGDAAKKVADTVRGWF